MAVRQVNRTGEEIIIYFIAIQTQFVIYNERYELKVILCLIIHQVRLISRSMSLSLVNLELRMEKFTFKTTTTMSRVWSLCAFLVWGEKYKIYFSSLWNFLYCRANASWVSFRSVTVNHFVILDLTPEQQKLLIELRRRKQELLLEIQVSEQTNAVECTTSFSSDEKTRKKFVRLVHTMMRWRKKSSVNKKFLRKDFTEMNVMSNRIYTELDVYSINKKS